MNLFGQLLQGLGVGRLIAIAAVGLGLILFFIFFTARITEAPMSMLYADLEIQDSGRIVSELEAAGIPYQLRANGSQILVPEDQVLRLRMSLAKEGLPSGGSIGYEIFDRRDTLGTTNFVQNVNFVRALEGELARTIRSLDRVVSARVHLVLPRRELFTQDRRKPSASIVLKTRGNTPLDKSQVAALQHLVSAAVPQLPPGNISIVDDSGNLLARGTDEESGTPSSTLAEFQSGYENRLKRSIEELLEQTVGFGKVRAEVSAEMDFDRLTVSSEEFDPDGQVVRSTQTIEENSSSLDTEGQVPVSVGVNLPEATAAQETSGTRSVSNNARTEETVNFEITKTNTTQIRESGIVERLSVAVLVDGLYTTGEDGEQIYEPRSDAELEQLATLVRTTVGFDAARGDQVEVVNMQFAVFEAPEIAPEDEPFMGMTKADYFQIGEMLVFAIVAILVILLVLRPIVGRALTVAGPEALAGPEGMPELGAEGTPALEGPAGVAAAAEPIEEESMIDMAQVEGRVKASSVRKIAEIIDKHPDEAVSIIRNWLYQES